LNLKTKTTKEELNIRIKEAALNGELVEQIKYSIDYELVSSDIVGVSAPAIFDSHATIADENTNSVVLYIWYDNEFGYSHQVIRLAKYISNVRRFTYY
jgi:glyceraldehyde 3-phosphate dehydrogenase